MLENVISVINDSMYTLLIIPMLLLGGIFFTVRTRAVQLTRLGDCLRTVTDRPQSLGKTSSFQALMVSTASRVGTGNVVGISTAICLGGFGSVFWMWVIALLGGATTFIESTLAQIYKRRGEDGESYGGAAYYVEGALGCRPLAVLFSILLILTYGFGFNMLTSYNLTSTLVPYPFYDPSVTPVAVGIILATAVSYCLFGGGKRILRITGYLVPIMGIAYVLVAVGIVVFNAHRLPYVLGRIFTDAFDLSSIFGGFGGSAVMYGIKRGLLSNESGVGSAPSAAAAADVSHPAKQGLTQILSVFIDTLIVCTATAFMCMCSGVEPTAELSGAPYVQAAMRATLGDLGPIFITVSIVLFGFTTLLGNLFYVDRALTHILGHTPPRVAKFASYILATIVTFVGAVMDAGVLWGIADVTMGLMTLINLPVIIYLSPYAHRALADYIRKKRYGKPVHFTAKSIGINRPLDYWQ